MATAKDIKKRIAGVKNIQQITRAMEMVAAARLRKAQEMAQSARPYAEKMQGLMENLWASVSDDIEHPLLEKREIKKVALTIITSDKGLCGAYNGNMIRKVQEFINYNSDKDITFLCIGKKGHDFFKRRNLPVINFHPLEVKGVSIEMVKEIAGELINGYKKREFDQVILFFTRFVTVMNLHPTERGLLPLERPKGAKAGEVLQEYLFEPSSAKLMADLLPRFIETEVYNSIVESIASELGSRLVSMRNATKNSGEMIDELTLTYNKARQASITRELLEIVSGADALSG
ncbi:MAG: ATP synthase F1 subunit gamma [Nitrospinota bacterium]